MSASHLLEIVLKHERDLFRFLLRRLKCTLIAQDLTHELFASYKADVSSEAVLRFPARIQELPQSIGVVR